MVACIYAFINIVNDKHYVGQAVDKDKRFKEHVKCLKGFYHHNLYLQRSWCKYGAEAFIFMMLEYCSADKLNEREQYWIDTLECLQPLGYNMAPVAGSMLGYKHSAEARKNMSEAHVGQKHSAETRLRMSVSKLGNQNAAGAKQSFEHIEARARVIRGKPKSVEQRAKMSASQKGRSHSEETRKKMSDAAKRRWNTIDETLKISIE